MNVVDKIMEEIDDHMEKQNCDFLIGSKTIIAILNKHLKPSWEPSELCEDCWKPYKTCDCAIAEASKDFGKPEKVEEAKWEGEGWYWHWWIDGKMVFEPKEVKEKKKIEKIVIIHNKKWIISPMIVELTDKLNEVIDHLNAEVD